jgi:hypothetical protein
MSVGVATAAGKRYYTAPDASVEQALAFVAAATPELAKRFIDAENLPENSPERPPGYATPGGATG